MKYWRQDRHWDKVSCCSRKGNPDNNISTALTLSAMVILSILYHFTMIQLGKIVIDFKSSWFYQVPAARYSMFCFEALSRVTDFYPGYSIFFSVLVFRRHANYKIAENWYNSVFLFSNYYYYQGEHLELWFSV
jgi:hypothetical protein